MKANVLRIMCFCLCIFAAIGSHAQTAPPPPPPPGTGGPGGPGGPGHPGGPGNPGSSNNRDGSRQDGQRRSPVDSRQLPNRAEQNRGAQSRNALQLGPQGRWWDDRSVVANIGINRQQQKKMDSIFDSHRPAIVNSYKTFLKAQENLQNVNKAAHPDQAKVFAAIDAVNQARADLQKAASAMLLQIRGEMSPDQIEKLESLQ
jgi:hypothetical protein